MALSSFLSSGGGGKKLLKFEIRPDSEYVFLRGGENETSNFKVKGVVVLMTSESMPLKAVRITLQGKRRTMHYMTTHEEKLKGPPVQSPIINKTTFLERELSLQESSGAPIRNLKPGNFEFPFEFELPGNICESVEGLASQFNTYDLKAVADRGVLAKDLIARKHIRIIRTLGEDPTDATDPQDVNGEWPDKIKYCFSAQSKAAIFGTQHIVDIELTPLLEKLEIGPIRCTLKETRRIKTIPGPEYVPDEGWRGMWKTEQDVHSFKMNIPDGSDDTDPQLQIPMYKFKARLDLPKSLQQCRQSLESEWFKVRHTVNFDILLKNPDGHWSELRAHYGLKLFISPNLPITGENHSVADGPDAALSNGSDMLGDLQTAPPDYQHHQLDQLYDDIDPAGFMTPGIASGSNTPGYSFSRRGSADNVLNLTAISQAAPNPEALQERLNDLQMHHHGSVAESGARHVSHPTSPDETPRSDSHPETPEQSGTSTRQGSTAYNYDELERITSYGTAIRAPMRHYDVPPPYRERRQTVERAAPEAPPVAHVRRTPS